MSSNRNVLDLSLLFSVNSVRPVPPAIIPDTFRNRRMMKRALVNETDAELLMWLMEVVLEDTKRCEREGSSWELRCATARLKEVLRFTEEDIKVVSA